MSEKLTIHSEFVNEENTAEYCYLPVAMIVTGTLSGLA